MLVSQTKRLQLSNISFCSHARTYTSWLVWMPFYVHAIWQHYWLKCSICRHICAGKCMGDRNQRAAVIFFIHVFTSLGKYVQGAEQKLQQSWQLQPTGVLVQVVLYGQWRQWPLSWMTCLICRHLCAGVCVADHNSRGRLRHARGSAIMLGQTLHCFDTYLHACKTATSLIYKLKV